MFRDRKPTRTSISKKNLLASAVARSRGSMTSVEVSLSSAFFYVSFLLKPSLYTDRKMVLISVHVDYPLGRRDPLSQHAY